MLWGQEAAWFKQPCEYTSAGSIVQSASQQSMNTQIHKYSCKSTSAATRMHSFFFVSFKLFLQHKSVSGEMHALIIMVPSECMGK